MLSNGRGTQVSHGELFGRECRDGFLAFSILWPTLCPLLCVLRVLFQHRHWSLPVCARQACWWGVTVLPVSAVQTWTWVFLSVWTTSQVDLTALNLTRGYFYCLILEGAPCAGSRGSRCWAKCHAWVCSSEHLGLTVGWAGGIRRASNGSLPMIWRRSHVQPPHGTKDACAASIFLLQIASFNKSIYCVQDVKGQWV